MKNSQLYTKLKDVIALGLLICFTLSACTSEHDGKSAHIQGRDLKPGKYTQVILELDVDVFLRDKIGNPEDERFQSACLTAHEAQWNGQPDFLATFFETMNNASMTNDEYRPLSDPNLFGTMEVVDQLGFAASDSAIRSYIEKELNLEMEETRRNLDLRLERMGIHSFQVSLDDKASHQLVVLIPFGEDVDRVIRVMETSAKLEFWRAEIGFNSMQFIVDANDRLRTILQLPETSPESSLGTELPPNAFNPLFEIFYLNLSEEGQAGEGPIIGYALPKDTGTIGRYLRMPEVRRLQLRSARNLRFLWTKKNHDGAMGLIAIKKTRNGEPELDGSVVVEARHGIDQFDYPIVTMVMNDQGTRKWQQITKEESSKTPKGYLAVVLDNLVYSHPLVNSEIRGGRTEISGGFTLEEAEDFALMLSVGQLPPLRVISIEDVNIPESKAKR